MDRRLSRPDVDEDLDMDRVQPPRTQGHADNCGKRALPGSGVVVGSGAGAGGGGNPEELDDDSAGGGGRDISPARVQDAKKQEPHKRGV